LPEIVETYRGHGSLPRSSMKWPASP
jgi:hypothetical protein